MNYFLSEEAREAGIEFVGPCHGDAGYDLQSVVSFKIAPNRIFTCSTGLHVEIPPGHVGIIKDRSSMAAKGIHALGGVIDSSYRGEIKVLLFNTQQLVLDPGVEQLQYKKIEIGDKIAQLVVLPVTTESLVECDSFEDLTKTGRGAGGFGSTGR